MEHIAIFAVFGGCGSCHISFSTAVDLTAVEDSCRLTENKVYSALYVAVLVVLTCRIAVGVKSVLTAEETAFTKDCTVAADKACHSLPYRSGAVFESEVLSDEIGCIDIA